MQGSAYIESSTYQLREKVRPKHREKGIGHRLGVPSTLNKLKELSVSVELIIDVADIHREAAAHSEVHIVHIEFAKTSSGQQHYYVYLVVKTELYVCGNTSTGSEQTNIRMYA